MRYIENNWLLPDDWDGRRSSWEIDQLNKFGMVYAQLGLQPTDFSGDVLAAGVGPLFPERLFWGNVHDKYRTFRSDIRSTTVCDVDPTYNPEDRMEEPFVSQYIGDAQVARKQDKNVFIPYSFWMVLKSVEQTYNAMTFCRIPNLPEQIGGDGVHLIAQRLRSGGMALLSGSLQGEFTDLFQIAEAAQQKTGLIATVEELPFVPDFFNLGVGGHYALLLKKHR